MAEVPTRSDAGQASAATPEVTFALILARLIEDATSDPVQLRSAIYEAARHKLQEQVTHEDPSQAKQLVDALEVAISGVENFAQEQRAIDARLGAPWIERLGQRRLTEQAAPENNASRWSRQPVSPIGDDEAPPLIPRFPRIEVYVPAPNSAKKRLALLLIRCLFVVGSAGAILAAAIYLQRRPVESTTLSDRHATNAPMKVAKLPTVPADQSAGDGAPQNLGPLPTTFGIFAVSSNQLYELALLPGRAPDLRVAMSAATTQPSKTTVPDGKIRFVINRRDSATSAVERAEVRVMARIARALTFDASGKPANVRQEQSWVLRNIFHVYRAAPMKDNPDMYELRSEDPGLTLVAGRYALVIKGAVYDFTVEGQVTDPKQCLERTQASNGAFYTECRKS